MIKEFYKTLTDKQQKDFIDALCKGTDHCPSVFGMVDHCNDCEGDCDLCYVKALEDN